MIEHRRMSQDEFMRKYNEEHREKFNDALFVRDNYEIVREVQKVLKSCERNRYFSLKLKNFRLIESYEEIYDTLYEHEESRMRKKSKKRENPYEYIPINDSDIMLLVVDWYIKINNGKSPDPNKPGDEYNFERDLQVLIAIPRYVNKYYMKINGTYYCPKLQIVDKSVYNNASTSNGRANPCNTQKTMFQPVRMFKTKNKLRTADGETVEAILFTTNIYSKTMDGMKYILAMFGLYRAMEFLGLSNYIHINTKPHEDTVTYYSFGAKKGDIFVIVDRKIFDADHMHQSFVSTLIRNFNKFSIHTKNFMDIYDPKYWLMCLGGEFNAFTTDKGTPVLDSIEDAYDIKTKELLRLPDDQKENIYCVLRWMFREFNQLRVKDINDVSSKRVRIGEYFANMLGVRMTSGLYRITDLGKNVTMDKILGAIYTKPMYLINAASEDNKLLAYQDMVNDNDAIIAASYTYKGISGLGDQGVKKRRAQKTRKAAVPIGIKLVQPTQIGITDPDTSSPGDPGVTGMMCPMCNINEDGSFIEQDEPMTWQDTFDDMATNYNNLKGMEQVIEFRKKIGMDYDKIKEDMLQETLATYSKLECPVYHRDGKIDFSAPPIYEEEEKTIEPIGDTGMYTGFENGQQFIQFAIPNLNYQSTPVW